MGVVLRQSAAVLLHRQGKVWLGQRGKTRFLPGFWVFPGGACEPAEDHETAARREVQEETGLVLRGPLRPLDRAITPAYASIRFDTWIYTCELSEDQEPVADDSELRQGRWFLIPQLLELRDRGEVQLAPPTARQLLCFQEILKTGVWPEPARALAHPPAWHQQILTLADGLTVIPLESNTIPPAGWTNSLIVGRKRLLVVDPGGADPTPLREELERRQAEGAQLVGVLLTHHHPDHLGGYLALELAHLPLWCHALTAPLLPANFPAPRLLEDGERLGFESGISLVAHWTPGHAPGHLTLQIPERKALYAADLVSSLSSIVIPTSNGDLMQYLESLQRMAELDCRLVIPSHGPPLGGDADPFGTAMAHRAERERQVSECLRRQASPLGLDELTQILYRGLDSQLFPAARANVWHHLKKLASEGKATVQHDLWSASAPPPTPG